MGRKAIQRPRNPVDWCWPRALGHLTRLFHGFGCSVHHGPRSWDSRHGAEPHRCHPPARKPRDGLELVAFFLWHRFDVHPSHGRRGLGTALVREVCEWATLCGYVMLTLTTFRAVAWHLP